MSGVVRQLCQWLCFSSAATCHDRPISVSVCVCARGSKRQNMAQNQKLWIRKHSCSINLCALHATALRRAAADRQPAPSSRLEVATGPEAKTKSEALCCCME